MLLILSQILLPAFKELNLKPAFALIKREIGIKCYIPIPTKLTLSLWLLSLTNKQYNVSSCKNLSLWETQVEEDEILWSQQMENHPAWDNERKLFLFLLKNRWEDIKEKNNGCVSLLGFS